MQPFIPLNFLARPAILPIEVPSVFIIRKSVRENKKEDANNLKLFQYMAKCCSAPPNDLVKLNSGDKTCNINAAALQLVNSYQLNKLQFVTANNSINLYSTSSKQLLGKASVWKIFIITFIRV